MPLNTKTISIGPIAAAAGNGIAASQAGTANTPLTISGSLVTGGVATMDVARRVNIQSLGNDTAITFIVVGTDRYGRPQTERLAGAGTASAQTLHDFLTVTSVTPTGNTAAGVIVGTNGVASSDAYIVDWVPNGNLIGAQAEVNGTINVSVQETLDDFSPAWDQANNTWNWFNDTNLSAVTQNTHNTLAGPFTAIRLTVNSGGTGSASAALKLITPFIGGRL